MYFAELEETGFYFGASQRQEHSSVRSNTGYMPYIHLLYPGEIEDNCQRHKGIPV